MSARRTILATFLTAAVFALTGCATTVSLDPAADANDPGCAEISVRLPDAVAGKARRQTDAQATGAWGEPAAVLLRCGVPPIGPTTRPCVTVNGIDWVLMSKPAAKTVVYQTFGRNPATEVIIDHVSGASDSSVLPEFASAVASVEQSEKCLSTLDTEVAPTSAPAK
ncbi:hypothetical protein ATY41_10975 [Leifsonia xyli subsp. xyli]|uniref:Secreted protein n=2 Tax=Leifsonia xyli subsp. xyli TaxID=59736 RepID=Q6AFK1_LEIXX|nr:DUF3515 family protein [Leifsonia xyli]AAT88844.1 secreted protein [Leifsonia xyli subsp. xyli str. CTCB07]ODA90204.1 hypothetical protein ATY41_10975 [Leifsonia xyli subsp. xyli]